ncbi:MAG TPA: hypothetical protein VF815_32905 [Myxococcaceae bacterium]|jgi:hypothetical protein
MKRKLLLTLTALAVLGTLTAAFRPASAGGNPLTRYALDAASRYTLCGHVEERIQAGSYLYLRVRDDATGATHWVATLRATASSASPVQVRVMARAERFTSPKLGRDFAPLLFGAVSEPSSCRSQSPLTLESQP